MTHPSPSIPRRVALGIRAFTLIEMLIAVGAVTLIAIGLAKLFSSTGQTVAAGQKISAWIEASSTIERQIRADLAAIAGPGQGFLVIRNKAVSGGPYGRPLRSDKDRATLATPRRCDELLFFAHGRFTSAREPQFPGRAPVGAAARIYYGHGMQRDAGWYGANLPALDEDPLWGATGAAAWPPGLGEPGPNEFAGSWILLRNVTTLARPQVTQSVRPNGANTTPPYITDQNWPDNICQLALQPAMASIFRFDISHPAEPDLRGHGYRGYASPTSNNSGPQPFFTPQSSEIARSNDGAIVPGRWPSGASGLVDLATVDLETIRARILGAPSLLFNDSLLKKESDPRKRLAVMMRPTPAAAWNTTTYSDAAATPNTIHCQKMLMASALPGNDPWLFGRGPGPGSIAGPTPQGGGGPEQRMLCSPVPRDFTGNLSGGSPNDEPYRQQDQAMLGASNLAIGCTEFIVEWSFGDVYPANAANPAEARTGKIIWHGLPRKDGTAAQVGPYRGVANWNGPYPPDVVAPTQQWTVPNPAPPPANLTYVRTVKPYLIHWPANITATSQPLAPDVPLYSFFGYNDPSYDPSDAPFVNDPNRPATIPWPWPKLLRFTYSLTDPADPTNEQTFQFVVELPGEQHGL